MAHGKEIVPALGVVPPQGPQSQHPGAAASSGEGAESQRSSATDTAARDAAPLLLKVLQAVYAEVSFCEHVGFVDGEKKKLWSIGPMADIPGGLLDLIRKTLALATPGKAVRG